MRKLNRLLRIAALRILEATALDLSIRHHWVRTEKLSLNSYRHRGYWWQGRNRELDTLSSIEKLVKKGDVVFDVGANIGYFSILFSHLVGENGKVIAFEPGEENLSYLLRNTALKENVSIDGRGISNRNGEASFFVESLTGQNNSLLRDYNVFKSNAAYAGVSNETICVTIETTTIDSFCEAMDLEPNFLKIDIEGAELQAIEGMMVTLERSRPVVLVEVSEDHVECVELFEENSYLVHDKKLNPLDMVSVETHAKKKLLTNYFFLPALG